MITEREWQATVANIEELKAELHLMKTAGIVEVAIRNPNVSEYMAHWERRAEGAEAKLAKALAELERAEAENEKCYDVWLDAQAEIIELEAKVRELEEYKWMYEELCK